jgi:hypothetical protein
VPASATYSGADWLNHPAAAAHHRRLPDRRGERRADQLARILTSGVSDVDDATSIDLLAGGEMTLFEREVSKSHRDIVLPWRAFRPMSGGVRSGTIDSAPGLSVLTGAGCARRTSPGADQAHLHARPAVSAPVPRDSNGVRQLWAHINMKIRLTEDERHAGCSTMARP